MMYFLVIILIYTKVVYTGSLPTSKGSDLDSEPIIGSPCSIENQCSMIPGAECNYNTSACQCSQQFPINLITKCVKDLQVGEACQYDEECSSRDSNSICVEERDGKMACRCRTGFAVLKGPMYTTSVIPGMCIQGTTPDIENNTVPAVAGLAIGLVILGFLLVFVVKLFSKARWEPARGYGDASVPPTIVIDGKDLSETHSRVYSAGDPLSPDELRKMSILSSVTIPLNKDINVRSVSPSNSNEHNLLFGEGAKDPKEYEQHITIISNKLSNERRKSLADSAFPELHSKKKKKSDNLLILTRTRTDNLGRRHSVAVPLIPPSQGYDLQADILSNNNTPRLPGRRLSRRRNSSQNSQLSQSPDRLNIPRRHSVRRSSKQDFLHFLDLAVAS